MALVSLGSVSCEGPTGAAIIVRLRKDEQVKKAAERVASLLKLSGFPLPRTMNDRAPMLPGMMPRSPTPARTAPFRVTKTRSP